MNNLNLLAQNLLLLLDASDCVDVLIEARKDGIITRFQISPFDDEQVRVWVGDDEYVIVASFEPVVE